MKSASIDYLIVGQGLAGSILADQLLRRGQRVLVTDHQPQRSASRTAAGIINTITGKRWVKSDRIETYLPAAEAFYHQQARRFNRPFYHSKKLIHLLSRANEIEQWKKRRADPDYQPFLGAYQPPEDCDTIIAAPFGSVQHYQCGYLDTAALLDALRGHFEQQQALCDQPFDYRSINRPGQPLQWRGQTIERIIFCEGHQVTNNPWFQQLPWQPAKGDILTLRTAAVLPDKIINRNQWLLPIAPQRFKFGATHQWPPFEPQPDPAAKSVLLKQLETFFSAPLEVELVEHKTGVRPGTRDRQPIIGAHPCFANLLLFNGFGSKGTAMIPWHATALADHLIDQRPLPGHADIRRYHATHFTD